MLAVEILLLFAGIVFVAASTTLELEGKIVGGKDADIKDFPYLVQVLIGVDACIGGASILSEYWVLTGANVVTTSRLKAYGALMYEIGDPFRPRVAESDEFPPLTIRSGSTSSFEGGQIHNFAEVHVFDTYNSTYYIDDIALIKVVEKFVYSATTQPINLPAKDLEVENGTIMQLSGWGDIKEFEFYPSEILQHVELPLLDFDTCVIMKTNVSVRLSFKMADSSKQVCTLNPGGGKDACAFDDGAPLMFNNTVIGIYSYGMGCADPNHPSVYTKVTGYLDWIKEISGV